MNATYCLVCKKLTGNINLHTVKDKKRLMMKSICSVCGNKKKYIYFKRIWFIR